MACPVCGDSGLLLGDVCPLCEAGEPSVIPAPKPSDAPRERPSRSGGVTSVAIGQHLGNGCRCFTCNDETLNFAQTRAELSKPQSAFWRHRWRLRKPGNQWTLTGHSRALVRTGFFIEELKVFLDAGVGWKNPNPQPSVICITHTHIDHCNALPMLLRTEASPAILAPRNHAAALKEMADMTWSVKRPGWDPLSRAPVVFPDCDLWNAPVQDCGEVDQLGDNGSGKHRRWVPVGPRDCISFPQKSGGFAVRTVRCYHTIDDVGYVLCELIPKREGVDAEAEAEFQQIQQTIEELKESGKKKQAGLEGRRIAEMKIAGRLRDVTRVYPRVAYLCDTTVQVFGPCAACRLGESCSFAAGGPYTPACASIAELDDQASLLLECSTIIVECSFVAFGMSEEEAEAQAISRGHIAWSQLRPIVETYPNIDFILVHFSERYSDDELRTFFVTASSSGGPLPNILLWLDEGLTRFDNNP